MTDAERQQLIDDLVAELDHLRAGEPWKTPKKPK